jgi:hypothetical protein
MSRLIVFVFLASIGISISFAQDTAKKQPVPKTYAKHTSRHHLYGYYRARADSSATDSALTALSHQSLNSQYRYLIQSVYHYQQPLISALWKNASDTVNANRAKLKNALAKLDAQNKLADSLKAQLSSQAEEPVRNNNIDIFGIVLSKTTYNLVVWGLVVLFAIIAFAVIARSAGYRREAAYRSQLYAELEEEYKNYKTKANDKEKKLARELQTERNKLDELLGRG